MSEPIVDSDNPTPPEELEKAQASTPTRDLGPVTPVLLEITHPKDENPQYVVRISNPENGELYGTLFASEDHVASAFGNFIAHHLDVKGI